MIKAPKIFLSLIILFALGCSSINQNTNIISTAQKEKAEISTFNKISFIQINNKTQQKETNNQLLFRVELNIYVGKDGEIGMQDYGLHSMLYFLSNSEPKDDSKAFSKSQSLRKLKIIKRKLQNLTDQEIEALNESSENLTGFTYYERLKILKEKLSACLTLIPSSNIKPARKKSKTIKKIQRALIIIDNIFPKKRFMWGHQGSGDGEFIVPLGIDIDSRGRVYVADQGNNRIQIFTKKGHYITQFGELGVTENNQFTEPFDVSVDPQGNIFVDDTGNNRIKKFDSQGHWITTWGILGYTNPGEFWTPYGMKTDQAGNVYVVDTQNHRIQKFDNDGSFLTQWGNQGNGAGQFNYPWGIYVGPEGNIWVTDSWNHRIEKFDQNGVLLATFGSQGSNDGEFFFPYGIAVDKKGYIYVADSWNHRIQIFDSNFNHYKTFGSEAIYGDPNNPIETFYMPVGIAIHKRYIYIVDAGNHRIQAFTLKYIKHL